MLIRKNVFATLKESFHTQQSRGATSFSFQGGGNFHGILFDDVIVHIQPWYNFFANGHR